jgi:hypothetical protein
MVAPAVQVAGMVLAMIVRGGVARRTCSGL